MFVRSGMEHDVRAMAVEERAVPLLVPDVGQFENESVGTRPPPSRYRVVDMGSRRGQGHDARRVEIEDLSNELRSDGAARPGHEDVLSGDETLYRCQVGANRLSGQQVGQFEVRMSRVPESSLRTDAMSGRILSLTSTDMHRSTSSRDNTSASDVARIT